MGGPPLGGRITSLLCAEEGPGYPSFPGLSGCCGAASAPALIGRGHPQEQRRCPIQEPQLCVRPQVVSGCLSSLVSVWEVATGRRTMQFSATGDQQMEMTTMCLDESERCLLTGLRDGTIKMWNYTIGECLLVFPNPDHLEVSPLCQSGPGVLQEPRSTALPTLGCPGFKPPFKAMPIDGPPPCLPEPVGPGLPSEAG